MQAGPLTAPTHQKWICQESLREIKSYKELKVQRNVLSNVSLLLVYFQALIFQTEELEKYLSGLYDCPETPRSGSASFCLFVLTLSIKSSALCHNCMTELDLLTCSLPRCVASDGIKVQNKCCHRLSLRVSSFPLLRSK